MIATIPFILAARSQGSGLVFFVFVAIWIISAIINGISKKAEEEKRKQLRARLEGSVARPPQVFQPQVLRAMPIRKAVAKPQSGGRAPPVMRQQLVRPAPKRKPVARETKRSTPRNAPPPIPAQQAQKQVIQSIVGSFAATKQEISATEIRGAEEAKAKPKLAVNSDSLHRWMRPETLRQQFMLTEVLQPPLALRPDRWNQ